MHPEPSVGKELVALAILCVLQLMAPVISWRKTRARNWLCKTRTDDSTTDQAQAKCQAMTAESCVLGRDFFGFGVKLSIFVHITPIIMTTVGETERPTFYRKHEATSGKEVDHVTDCPTPCTAAVACIRVQWE